MLTIGGTAVRVWSRSLTILDTHDPHYAEFVTPAAYTGGSTAALDVEVVLGPPSSAGGEILFDSGTPWLVRADGDGYRLEFNMGDVAEPHTVVCCDAATSRAVVHVLDLDGAEPPVSTHVPDPFCYPVDQLVLMNHFAARGAVIVHSAGLRMDVAGETVGLVFPGASGAGKTTLSEMLTEAGAGEGLLSDDRMILRLGDEGSVTAWGTPWPGDAGIAHNEGVPLRSLLFLRQADTDEIVPIGADEALRRLMPVVSCPWYDRLRFPAVLDTCGRVVAGVSCQELRFTRSGAVTDVLARHAASLGSR
jgi:hypothetical protein